MFLILNQFENNNTNDKKLVNRDNSIIDKMLNSTEERVYLFLNNLDFQRTQPFLNLNL